MQYVGQTYQQASQRTKNNSFDINNYNSFIDFSFLPIDVVNNEMTETYWIHKLDTLYHNGMNSKLLYNV